MAEEWGWNLEEWMRDQLKRGYPEIVTNILRLLPEEKKEKYRALWVEIMAEKRKEEENKNG